MTELPTELIAILKNAQRVAALTGAGVSQESGLRTFRDAQVGLWAQYKPEDLATPEAFARDPLLVWDWYAMRREKNSEVKPNPGHFALAEMARRFPVFTLITQNVDGLHQRAGSPQVIELHGNIQQVKCSQCETFASEWSETQGAVPRCQACGGLLRPHVVWFGEALPRQALAVAVTAARECEVFFSIGTSGQVQPAASLAFAAHNRQACLVQINAEQTPLTAKADFFLTGKSGEILPEIVRAVWES